MDYTEEKKDNEFNPLDDNRFGNTGWKSTHEKRELSDSTIIA